MPGLLYTTIVSGASVSGNLNLTKNGLYAIAMPTTTSGDLLVQGNFDTTSSTFYRLQTTRPNTDVRFATGLGSAMVLWPSDLPSPPYARLETAVAQTDIRSITILVR